MEKYSDDPPEVKDKTLYPENEEDKVYPFNDLPIIFHRVWRELNKRNLQEFKKNATWTNLNAYLCDGCYHKFAETAPIPDKYQVQHSRKHKEDGDNQSPESPKHQLSPQMGKQGAKGGKDIDHFTLLPSIKNKAPSKKPVLVPTTASKKIFGSTHNGHFNYADTLIPKANSPAQKMFVPLLSSRIQSMEKVGDSKDETRAEETTAYHKSTTQRQQGQERPRKRHPSTSSLNTMAMQSIDHQMKSIICVDNKKSHRIKTKKMYSNNLNDTDMSNPKGSMSMRRVDYDSCMQLLKGTEHFRSQFEL